MGVGVRRLTASSLQISEAISRRGGYRPALVVTCFHKETSSQETELSTIQKIEAVVATVSKLNSVPSQKERHQQCFYKRLELHVDRLKYFDTEYDRAKVPPYNGNDPRFPLVV